MAFQPTPQPSPVRRAHAGLIGAGLIAGALALFLSGASLRELLVEVNRARFVPAQAEVVSWGFAPGRASSGRARVVSTGEEFLVEHRYIMDLGRAQALAQAGQLEGHRTPVYYLPATAPWSALDHVIPFRILEPEQFELGFSPGLPLANAALAWLAVVLVRRGLRHGKAASAPQRSSNAGP